MISDDIKESQDTETRSVFGDMLATDSLTNLISTVINELEDDEETDQNEDIVGSQLAGENDGELKRDERLAGIGINSAFSYNFRTF